MTRSVTHRKAELAETTDADRITVMPSLGKEQDIERPVTLNFQDALNFVVQRSHVEKPEREIVVRGKRMARFSRKSAKHTRKARGKLLLREDPG